MRNTFDRKINLYFAIVFLLAIPRKIGKSVLQAVNCFIRSQILPARASLVNAAADLILDGSGYPSP